MDSRKILIYGAGHLGRQVLHHIRNYCPGSDAIGYVDDTLERGDIVRDGVRVLGSLDEVACASDTTPDRAGMVFAIGYKDMRARRDALERVVSSGYSLISIIHPGSIIEPDAAIEPGVIVLAGAIIDQNVKIGTGCFVDIGVRLGENTVVGKSNYFSSGAAIGGAVEIGNDCFFGMDCTVTNDIRVGNHCFVNAKTLVARNLPDDTRLVELHKHKELRNS